MPAEQSPDPSEQRSAPPILGIDFSGAETAGRSLWVAEGVLEGDTLVISKVTRGDKLPNSGPAREACHSALLDYLGSMERGVVGLDFPVGIPRPLIPDPTWDDFIRAFPSRYPTADAFRQACKSASPKGELKRLTDIETLTPFAVYNLRLYRQTYFGIRNILYPLVMGESVYMPPMQVPKPDRLWLVESCPASILKDKELYKPYKGGAQDRLRARRGILRSLQDDRLMRVKGSKLKTLVEKDKGGDALDACLAALGALAALKEPIPRAPHLETYRLEGYVYL